jgi:predicted phage terminase large subunit-like protein
MTVEELRQLANECKVNPNYQHKDKSWEELDEAASASFNRLPDAQKKHVLAVCKQYGVTNGQDFTEMQRWRYLAQTNLFFLCKLLEKYRDVSEKEYIWKDGTTHNTHEEICNAFFVHKNPTYSSFKGFASGYLGKKERLLLVPRGGFKSSIDMADVVQWVICFPEVTILILTGVLDLAKDFVKEIKSHFELEDDIEKGVQDTFFGSGKKSYKPRTLLNDTPSMFQILFPEHCIPKEDGKATEFQTPASSLIQKECTVFAASIDQNLSGWHVGVLKLDDVVTNENSRTVDRIRNINKQVSINNAMLHPYGFYDKIGTWYDSEDTYGQDIKHIEKCLKDGEDVPMQVYLRPAWWPNEAAVKAGKIEEEMVESDWEFWFNEPGQLTYKFLRGKKIADPEGFAIKYLNDPLQAHRVKFPRELLIRRTIPATMLPQQGMIVTCVDTAYSTKSWADYTVILTALIYGGRFYIIDMKRGRYDEFVLPQIIAATANQWKPKRICIEDSVGVKWLGREIYKEMDKLRVRVPIEFVPLGQGNKANAKEQKAKPVLRYLGDERLIFVNQCPSLEELYTELEKFGTAACTHDDIVSALSILVMQFAAYADMEGKVTAAQTNFIANPTEKHHYDIVYGVGQFDQFNANFALDYPDASIKEIADAFKEAQADVDPLADLF